MPEQDGAIGNGTKVGTQSEFPRPGAPGTLAVAEDNGLAAGALENRIGIAEFILKEFSRFCLCRSGNRLSKDADAEDHAIANKDLVDGEDSDQDDDEGEDGVQSKKG